MTETIDIDFVVQALPAVMLMQSSQNFFQGEPMQWVIGLCLNHQASCFYVGLDLLNARQTAHHRQC